MVLQLLILAAVPLAAQFGGVTATNDGATIYFSTRLRLKTESLPDQYRIYSYSAGTARLVYEVHGEPLYIGRVSENGRTLVAPIGESASLVIRDGAVERISGRAMLSRNGRYLATERVWRDLETGELHPIPESVKGTNVTDDGRLLSGNLLWSPRGKEPLAGSCWAAGISPDGIHVAEICTRIVITGPLQARTTCDVIVKNRTTGAFMTVPDHCTVVDMSNEWVSLATEIVSLADGRRMRRRVRVHTGSITGDESTEIHVDGSGAMVRWDIRGGAGQTILQPQPFLIPEDGYVVPGSLFTHGLWNPARQGAGVLIGGRNVEMAETLFGRLQGVAPLDLPVGMTTIQLVPREDSPFEQAPIPFRVLDWQPRAYATPQNCKPGFVCALQMTGLRFGRTVTVMLRAGTVEHRLEVVRYYASPVVSGTFVVEVRLPLANQLPPPVFDFLNFLPVQVEAGPPGPIGEAKFEFNLQVRD